MERTTEQPVIMKNLTWRQKITMIVLTFCVLSVIVLNILNFILA